MTELLRSALAGAATGCRAFTGVAALTLATPSKPPGQPDQLLSKRWVKSPAAALAVQELALDKLPQAPSRPGRHRRRGPGRAKPVYVARHDSDAYQELNPGLGVLTARTTRSPV